ncbi:MAG TPA: hypothetical protein VGQ09_09365 [Chitinophagaceae bacterium]|nr:hypothetical protein [Chitinophagaceae bacterium]
MENSIRHGLKYKTEGDGLIKIIVQKKENGILISIEDNDIGRDAAKQYKSKNHLQYQSKGMTISEDRVKMLNSVGEEKIKRRLIDPYNSKKEAIGTRLNIYLLNERKTNQS